MSDRELLLNKLDREQRARREAELLLEAKSLELHLSNEELRRLNDSLEDQIKHRTDELARQASEAMLLHRVTSIAAEAESVEQALRETLQAICEVIGWPIGHVFRLDGESNSRLMSSKIWHLPDDSRFQSFRDATEQICFEHGVGLPGRVLASRSPAWINDVGTDSNYPRNNMLANLPVHGAFAFPVITRGVTFAVLEFYRENPVSPDENLLRVMGNIGIQLGQAFDRLASQREREEHSKILERSNRELQEFAYVASHDLKSPLRAILHLAQWIAEDENNTLSEQSLNDLHTLQTRSSAMAKLLDDLLAYSRVGRKAYESVEVDTGELIEEIVSTLDKPVDFSIRISKRLPTLTTPLIPLRMVLQNLIENAIKHHDRTDGCVEIDCQLDDDFVQFQIIDDGPGIPETAFGKVFEIFVALGGHDSEGSGMGLALVKKTVETHGGAVWIENATGESGVAFQVQWPKQPSAREA